MEVIPPNNNRNVQSSTDIHTSSYNRYRRKIRRSEIYISKVKHNNCKESQEFADFSYCVFSKIMEINEAAEMLYTCLSHYLNYSLIGLLKENPQLNHESRCLLQELKGEYIDLQTEEIWTGLMEEYNHELEIHKATIDDIFENLLNEYLDVPTNECTLNDIKRIYDEILKKPCFEDEEKTNKKSKEKYCRTIDYIKLVSDAAGSSDLKTEFIECVNSLIFPDLITLNFNIVQYTKYQDRDNCINTYNSTIAYINRYLENYKTSVRKLIDDKLKKHLTDINYFKKILSIVNIFKTDFSSTGGHYLTNDELISEFLDECICELKKLSLCGFQK